MHTKSWMGLGLALVVASTACSEDGQEAEPVGAASIAITAAPADVSCVRLTVTGTRTVVRPLDVVPGQSTVFTVAGLPIGPDTFSADAFAVACASVDASAAPTWVSEPVQATIATGMTTAVTLQLRRNGVGRVSIDFVDDGAGGGTGTPVVVAAGFHHTCALVNQTVKCWGANESGQLGDGTLTQIGGPVTVNLGGGPGVFPTDVTVGQNHSCALMSDATVRCWGRNTFGQVGDFGAAVNSPLPTSVSTNGAVTAIAAGGDHTCAIRTFGDIVCWGRGPNGELGNGGTGTTAGPVVVAGISNASSITAGIEHTCATRGNGTLAQCWGSDASGQLGNGPDLNDSSVPVDVMGLTGRVLSIDGGGPFTCALVAGPGMSKVLCWGGNFDGELGFDGFGGSETAVSGPALTSPLAIAAGGLHGCALVADPSMVSGRLAFCWGSNTDGQLGNGTSVTSATPVAVSGLGGQLSNIAAGGYHTCVGGPSGTVQCWGGNDFGQLGDRTTTPRSVPGPVLF